MIKSQSYTYSGHEHVSFPDLQCKTLQKPASSSYFEIDPAAIQTSVVSESTVTNESHGDINKKSNHTYFSLDPSETGYDRRNNTQTYELAKPIFDDITDDTDDTYVDMIDDIYDHTNDRRHKIETTDDVYSHSVEDTYDSATQNQLCSLQGREKNSKPLHVPLYENVCPVISETKY